MSEYNNELIEFPKDWEIKRLGKIAEQMYYGLSVSGVDTPTQYKLITTTSINKETFKLDEENTPFCNLITNKDRKSKELTKYFVKKGDILISRSGTTGITILIDKDYNNMLFGSYLIKIRLNSIIDPKFFWYFAQSPFYWKQISSRGTTIKNINLEILRNLRVPIPPLEEQKKIIEILNTVDFIITDTTNLIEKLRVIKEKTLNLLITGKIWHKEFKDTEIGRIPGEWKIVKLEEITTKISDIDHKMPKKQKKGIPFVSIKCMLKYPDLNFYLDLNDPDLEFISKEDYEYYARRFNVEKGDIIYSRFGSIGHAKLVTTEQPFIASYSIVLIKPDTNKVNSAFLTYILNSEVVMKQAKIATKGSTNKNLHLRDIKNLKIPLPPLKEQKKIVEILSTIDNKIELETKYLKYLKRLKEKLLAALMMGKIRVKRVNSIKINNLK